MYSAAKLTFARRVSLAMWIFAGACFFFPLYYMAVGPFGRTLFGILLCVHVIEFFVFLGLYQRAGGSLFGHFARTIAYGVIHKTEVEQGLAET
jgi:hypothetical protein